ncbi:hypothetical protein MKC54_09195 [[Clostridium] innocuum]|nr:hypothetical protein [[Clostridium] innocuum]MCR0577060.1 hypothetical protein [[Clostridium] innocuum]
MKLLYTNILTDSKHILMCYAVLLLAFAANVILSMYFNISLSSESFEPRRLWRGIKKAAVLIIGTLLMVIAVDAAAILLTQNLNEEVHDFITASMIAATIGVAAWRYMKNAYQTFVSILNKENSKSVNDIEP